MLVPKPREFYYPELGCEGDWNLPPWEVQWDRGVPLPELPGKAKAPLALKLVFAEVKCK